MSAHHSSAGCLCMVVFKAAHKKEWKLLEDFIRLQGRNLEFLGTPHLCHLPRQLVPQSVFGHEDEGTGYLSCLRTVLDLCACVGLLQGEHAQPQQDCHGILFVPSLCDKWCHRLQQSLWPFPPLLTPHRHP